MDTMSGRAAGIRLSIWKRLADVACSVVGGLCTSPLILIGMMQSRAELDERPIFRQTRIGLHGREFDLMKIRTMPSQQGQVSTVTLNNDDRVPPRLRWLRDYKIDELPQLWNVLKGDMSIVGPRPTVPSDVDLMSEIARRRHHVRPGLTGLSQIRGNAALTWPQRIEYDLEYVETSSFLLDLTIVARTALAVLRKESSSSVESGDEWDDGDTDSHYRR